VGLIKLEFHPGTDMAQATAETVAYVDRARAFMPTGTVPPFVLRFDGGSVPVGDLVFSSKTQTLAELRDAALFKVRPMFATLPGVFGAAALRREPAHHSYSLGSGQAAFLQHVAGRGGAGVGCRQHGQSIG
jgi:hypothetical protein